MTGKSKRPRVTDDEVEPVRRLAEHDRDEVERLRLFMEQAEELNGHTTPGAILPMTVWTMAQMRDLEPPSWVVEDLLQARTRFLLFGQSGHHKTNVAVDIGCHVGHGMDWHGRKVAEHPVIIVATEDPQGAAMRVVGWHDRHGARRERVLIVPGGELRLNDPGTVDRLIATARTQFPGERPGFIIDHYDVSIEGDPTATEQAKDAAEGLRELNAGAAFTMLLAHTPWTNGERAKVPVSLWANVDARAKIERDEVTGQATFSLLHQKNGRSGLVLGFEFELHEFATRRGEASCLIPKLLDGPPKSAAMAAKRKPLGANEKLLLEVIDATLVDHGREAAQAGALARDIPHRAKVVKRDALQEAADRYLAELDPQKPGNRRREVVSRVLGSLQARGLIRHVDGWVWRPSHDIA